MGERGHVAGLYEALVYRIDDDGYPMGTLADPNNPAAGTTTHAFRTKGPVSVTAPSTTYRTAQFVYGMKNRGSRNLGVSDFGTFELTLSSRDSVFDTLIGGGAIDDTISTSYPFWSPNTGNPTRPAMGLILTMGYQDVDTGSNGFLHTMYPRVEFRPAQQAAGQDDGVNPNPNTFEVIPTVATRTPFGLLVDDTELNLEDDSDIVFYWDTDDRIQLTTYIAAAAATSFTLGYRPLYTDVLAGTRNIFTLNGDVNSADVTALNATTGVATIASATINHVYVAVTETNYASI